MDCEETYDLPSFLAFCEMLIGIRVRDHLLVPMHGAAPFWVKALWSLEQKRLMRHVKWWNLQCYYGGPDEPAGRLGGRDRKSVFGLAARPGLSSYRVS